MEKTDTLKLAKKRITKISGGELQRVIFTRALVQNPKIFLFDEAFSAMDILYRVKSLRLIKKEVLKKDKVVVAIMHDLNTACHFCDQIIAMKGGKIKYFGEPSEIMKPDKIREVFDIKRDWVRGDGIYVG